VECFADAIGSSGVRSREETAAEIESGADRGVAEVGLDHVGVLPLVDQERGVGAS